MLKIYARPGEVVSSETGVADVGQTIQIYAIAKVYQSDISKVEIGQKAQITSSALPDVKLTGTVEKIGFIVERQDGINADPTDNTDSRIVEVDIRLESASQFCKSALIPQPLLPKVGEGELDQSPSPKIGRGI